VTREEKLDKLSKLAFAYVNEKAPCDQIRLWWEFVDFVFPYLDNNQAEVDALRAQDFDTMAREADEAGRLWAEKYNASHPGCLTVLIVLLLKGLVYFVVFVAMVWASLEILGR